MLGYDLVLVTLHWGLQLVSSKTIRIGDTKYDISVLEEGAKPIQPLIIIIIRKSYISPRLGESCNIVVFMFLLFARVSPTLILKVGLLGKLNFIHCIYIFFLNVILCIGPMLSGEPLRPRIGPSYPGLGLAMSLL